jgi:uncharacterized Tic20 family protein
MNRATAMNDFQKSRRGRNWAMLAALVALVVLVFFVTLARLGSSS